ncbi:hypothetical protein UF75_1166 [Desulfosporosinus sp. I2]|uniref:hypothetical protein n=1 Tax=Desulfosporosinus sp. I2 TaxID=1617025 RepID=UPI0005EE602E|nr:hypothetical protein [Desulfosporosinus sp. I2]KJR48500.1 hypothetical protein UF75_1166 [Desulfosporosinus sp. I2]
MHDIDDGIRNGLTTKYEFKKLWGDNTDLPFNNNWIDHLIFDVINSSQDKYQITFSLDFDQDRRKETQDDIGPIKKEIKEVESTIENWMQALGKGIKGLVERIVEAQNKADLLREELDHINMLQKETEISDKAIYDLLKEKKDALYSNDENEKKRILQEYVDKVIVNLSDNINTLDVEITYRVFNGGGEAHLFKPSTKPRLASTVTPNAIL